MIPLVIGLALGAALLHATWNVLLKTSGDPLRVSTRGMSAAALLATPVALGAWLLAGRPGLPAAAWLLAAVSAIAELAYFVFLSDAYRQGELSVVYPLARGSAPLLAVLTGVVLLREPLGPVEAIGVLLLLTGMWAVRRPAAPGPALLPALLTGICIAMYSTIDQVGVHQAPPWLYGWLVWVLTAGLLLAWQQLGPRRPRPTCGADPRWPRAVVVGLLMTLAYLLVLIAFRLAPLVVVAPLRESAIVLVTGWGVWRLQEQQGAWVRLGGAVGIVAGILLLALR